MMESLTKKVERETSVGEWIDLLNKGVDVTRYLMENIGTPNDLYNTDKTLADSFIVSNEENSKNVNLVGIDTHGFTKRKQRYKEDDIVKRLNALLFLLEKLYGNLNNLTTDSKESFVKAINELKQLVGDSAFIGTTLIDDINRTSSKLYDNNMYKLRVETDQKKNFVRAINNVIEKLGSSDLSSLETGNKSNFIAAINEIVSRHTEELNTEKENVSMIGNVNTLKDSPIVVKSLNSAYNKLGQASAFYHSTTTAKSFGVEAINHYIDKIGIIPDDLTTVSRSNLVSAVTELHSWIDKGKFIYSRTNQEIAIGKTSAVGARLDINGKVLADGFTGPLEGNVVGHVLGNVNGNVSGTSKSWKKEISIKAVGAITGSWIFGGESFKNIDWKKFYKPYKYYENTGYYEWVNKTIKDGYWHKFKEKVKVPKKVSYKALEPSGYNKESKVLVKQGYWKNVSTYIPAKSNVKFKHTDANGKYNFGANGKVRLWESDANGSKLKLIASNNNPGKKIQITPKTRYVLADIEKPTVLPRKTFFNSSRVKFAEIRPFLKRNGFKHVHDQSWGLGMSAGTFNNKSFEIQIPLNGNPTQVEMFICCWHRSFEQSAYAWWIEDLQGRKHKIHAAGSKQSPSGTVGLPAEYRNVSGLSNDHIHKKYKINVPNGAKRLVLRWVMNDGGWKKDWVMFKQLKVWGTWDQGPASAFLETSWGGRVKVLKGPSTYRTRKQSDWAYSTNWLFGSTNGQTIIWDLYKKTGSSTPARWITSKKWVDTSYYKTVTTWVNTSKYVTKYKTIQQEQEVDRKKWINRDRVVKVKRWKDTSKWITRYKIDQDALAAAEKEAGRKYNIFVQNNAIRGKAKSNHLHDDRYLKLGQGSTTKYHYFTSCVSSDSAWSSMNSMYNVSNYHNGSTVIARDPCGRNYVWVKYKDGVSAAAWLRLK